MMGTASLFGGGDRFHIPASVQKNYNHQNSSRIPVIIDETETPSSDTKNNLERFLDATRPSVPAQCFPETTMILSDFQPYFILNDLWESFKEFSTYGIGVPLVLNGGYSVIQYYIPYLSGIQIYGEPATLRSDSKFRLASEDGDLNSPRDTSSDVCLNPQNVLLFQFLGQGHPHEREPLAYKMNDLAKQYPGLKTLRSCDIQETSWFSVAWYPIYRIPCGPTLKNLDASFLTYHNLSTRGRGKANAKAKISLPAFGMSSYKLRNMIWEQTDNENQMAKSLLQEADKWLRSLHVNQPDYNFFALNYQMDSFKLSRGDEKRSRTTKVISIDHQTCI